MISIYQPKPSYEDDRKWMNHFLHLVEDLQNQEKAQNNTRMQNQIFRTTMLVSSLFLLLGAYKQSPDKCIDGEKGIAKKLGHTKQQIFVTLAKLGLEPRDFYDPNVTIACLVEKSTVASFARKILESNGRLRALLTQE